MHYSGMTGPLLIKNNISWGHNFNYSVKPGDQQERLENCVGLGFIRISTNKMSHNLIGGGNEYDRSSNAPADNILFLREQKLDKDFEFADPLNLDFRLQPDSRFRGTAPDGSDRGPYPYKANIFYVSPAGDDQADGLSMRKPWRTLARALKGLRPGDTLYLAEGEYAAAPWNKAGDGKSPIRILRPRPRDGRHHGQTDPDRRRGDCVRTPELRRRRGPERQPRRDVQELHVLRPTRRTERERGRESEGHPLGVRGRAAGSDEYARP